MKKVCVGMMILGLAMLGFSSAPVSLESHWEWLEKNEKERFDQLKKEYNDPKKLKEHFEKNFLVYPTYAKDKVAFKRIFGVSDNIMLPMLMDFIRETSAKTGWKRHSPMDEPEDFVRAVVRLRMAIEWLGYYAGADTKQFLMGIITDNEKEQECRSRAVFSYLLHADVEETQNVLHRLFTDELWAVVCPVGGPYSAAMWAYDIAENDTKKREIIVATVSNALIKEGNKAAFVFADKLLAERSKDYAESPQRKAALQRMNIQVEKETP